MSNEKAFLTNLHILFLEYYVLVVFGFLEQIKLY